METDLTGNTLFLSSLIKVLGAAILCDVPTSLDDVMYNYRYTTCKGGTGLKRN